MCLITTHVSVRIGGVPCFAEKLSRCFAVFFRRGFGGGTWAGYVRRLVYTYTNIVPKKIFLCQKD